VKKILALTACIVALSALGNTGASAQMNDQQSMSNSNAKMMHHDRMMKHRMHHRMMKKKMGM
jgi:hypothetical protein